MELYHYLSLIPESLVVSMLPAAEFGTYLAAGTKKRSREHAVYFELKENFQSEYFDLEKARHACVAHPDGNPKHSVYVSIYRVLEHIPLTAIGDLWLTTRDGRSLKLTQSTSPAKSTEPSHLYQELCPVHSTVVSSLGPAEMCKFITSDENAFSVPKICFVELTLGVLVQDPINGDASDLPYKDIPHLRDCLNDLASKYKTTKTVNRIQAERFCYRCIKGGFFLGKGENVLYYPFPSAEQLEKNQHEWWRSANMP